MTDQMLNRFSGLAVACFGAALLFWVIPGHVETVDYGWVRPDTLPRICGWALIGLGVAQAVFAGGATQLDLRALAIVALAVALSAAAIWGFGRFGFLITAPIFVASIIGLIGERRWAWIVVTVFGAPALIWVVVEHLLGRPLP